MKNLKRVLSLALSTVMVIGMMVVGANATFADQADIKYTDAVDMLTGLGVINGMGNNTFAPNGTLTRAQAAKMVAYVKAGANENTVGYYDGETKFKDVTNDFAWAKGSINYCVANGIVSGMTATTFEPNTTQTGAQLAKMLLVALGYPETSQKDTETLVGANWQVNTLRKATQAGLFKGLDSSFAAVKAVTRQEAAQIMYNALNANVVKVGSWDMYGNPNYVVDTTTTLLTSAFDVVEVTGTVTANQATGEKATTIYVDATHTYKVEYTTGLDMIGHKVTALVKTDNNGMVQNKTTKNYEVYGIMDEATLAVSYVASGDGIEADLKAQGFSKTSGGTYLGAVTISENYVAGSATTTNKGDAIVAISNNDNLTVDAIVRVKSQLNKVTAITTKGTGKDAVTTYTFDAAAGVTAVTKTSDKLNVYDGIAANDFVIVTKVAADFYNIEKVATATATVTGFTNNKTVRTGVVAGSTYAQSAVDTTTAITGVTTFNAITAGNCVLLLDGNGNLIGATSVTAVVNYAYIAKVESSPVTDANGMTDASGLKALVYFADGTSKALVVNTTDSVSGITASTTGLYNVTIDGAGKAVVKAITDTTGDVTAITKGVSKATASTVTYTDANTVAFFVNGSYSAANFSVTVQTGTANISSTSVDGSYYKTVGGTNYATVLLVNHAPADTKVDVVYYNGVYAQSTQGGVTTTIYTVYKDGVATTVSYKNVSSVVKTAGFYKTSAANIVATTPADDKTVNDAAVTAFVNGTLTAGGVDYQVTDKTVVVNLIPDSTLALADLVNTNLVNAGTGKIAVSYTVDAATSVKTASVIFITAATMA